MSSTEIKFNKEQANYGIEQLKQCQKELYEADKLFYKGIMALASAKGMDLILREDAGINLYMPEKIVIECREEVAALIEEISSKIALVQDFNEEPKEKMVSVDKIREWLEDNFFELQDVENDECYIQSNFDTFDRLIDSFNKIIKE